MKKLSTILMAGAVVLSLPTGVYAKPVVIAGGNLPSGFHNLKAFSQQNCVNQAISFEELCKQLGIDKDYINGSIGGNQPDIIFPDSGNGDVEKPDFPDNFQPEEDDSVTENSSFEKEVISLVNKERQKAGLAPLKENSGLQKAADVRAKELKASFSHTRPNGSSFSTVLKENGVSYRGSGENIAWGQTTPEQVMNGWMNSAGHKANILNANFTSIGVGYYTVNGTPYWVQLFTY